MLGKLDWSVVPLGEPIPLAAGAAVFLVIVAVLDGSRAQATGALSGRNGSRASITSGSA
jgi:ABC-type nitrate/sulfonate/bicarbonate transport system substrate-binding protein